MSVKRLTMLMHAVNDLRETENSEDLRLLPHVTFSLELRLPLILALLFPLRKLYRVLDEVEFQKLARTHHGHHPFQFLAMQGLLAHPLVHRFRVLD